MNKMQLLNDSCLIKTFILYELGSCSKELTLKKYGLILYKKCSAIHIEKDKNITGESNIKIIFTIRKMKNHFFLALNNSLNTQ